MLRTHCSFKEPTAKSGSFVNGTTRSRLERVRGCRRQLVTASGQRSVAFSFDHGIVRHLHAAGLTVAAFQSSGHAVSELEVGIRHVGAECQLKVAPVRRPRPRRRRVLLEPAHNGHVISVSGGGDLADGGGAPRAAKLQDAAPRPAPPDRLQQQGRQRSRPGPALVRIQQDAAAAGVRISPAAATAAAVRPPGQRRRPAAGRPAPAAAAQQRGVVAEDATSGATAVLIVEQLHHSAATNSKNRSRSQFSHDGR